MIKITTSHTDEDKVTTVTSPLLDLLKTILEEAVKTLKADEKKPKRS